jgi:hypothetical protein
VTADEPRPAELSRRVDDLRDEMRTSFQNIGVRLDRMPTNDILLAYLATRDQEMKTLGEDVKELTAAIAQERAERQAAVASERTDRESAIKEQAARIENSRRWGIGIALTALGVLVGVVTFIVNVSGGTP